MTKYSSTTLCTQCKANGETQRLMYTELTFPRMFCEKGHEFGSAEEAEAQAVTPQPVPEKPVEVLPAPAKPVLVPVHAMDTPPVRPPDGPEPDQEDISRAKIAPDQCTATIEPEALFMLENTESSKTPPRRSIKFVPPPARSAPGGVLLMTVRIPDHHVSALKAEAETQKQSVETFLQDRLEYALECRWIY
jgi:hypothetical protein